MKRVLILASIICCISCSSEELLPLCIQVKISSFQNTAEDCPGALIQKFEFQDNILYGFTDGTCISDGGTILIDENCEDVCFIGGIAGFTDCQNVPFFDNARLIETIWESK